MQGSDVKRLKSLEEENLQLKRLVGQQAFNIGGFKNALSKKCTLSVEFWFRSGCQQLNLALRFYLLGVYLLT